MLRRPDHLHRLESAVSHSPVRSRSSDALQARTSGCCLPGHKGAFGRSSPAFRFLIAQGAQVRSVGVLESPTSWERGIPARGDTRGKSMLRTISPLSKCGTLPPRCALARMSRRPRTARGLEARAPRKPVPHLSFLRSQVPLCRVAPGNPQAAAVTLPPALPGDGGGRPGDGFPAGSRPARPHPGRCPASGGVLPCSAGLIRPYKPEMRKLRVDRSGYRPESPINWT